LRETWQGILGEARFQKPLCKWLTKSNLLRKIFKRRPTTAERLASWKKPGDFFAYLDSYHDHGRTAFGFFGEMVPAAGKKVLDVGCGQAVLSCRYAQAGAQTVVGCDRNYEGWPLRNAKTYLERKRLQHRVLLLQGDAAALPVRDRSFDLIVMNDVGDHIVELGQALQECYRVLTPGGHVVITFIPWYHPGGFHMMNYISIPYAHLIFSEKAIVETLLEMAEEDPAIAKSISGLRKNPPPASFDDMDIILSRVTIAAFKRLLKETDFRISHFRLLGFGHKTGHRLLAGALNSLTRIPVINELFTSRINCVLQKPGKA